MGYTCEWLVHMYIKVSFHIHEINNLEFYFQKINQFIEFYFIFFSMIYYDIVIRAGVKLFRL
jgi:hypothetical protein